MLKQAKKAVLQATQLSGISWLVLNSGWRRARLLILCYHGVATADEDQWNPELYIQASLLDRRLNLVRKQGGNILPFGEAVERLQAGTLPPRAVAVTFDDGNYDFYRNAYPVLEKHQVPATVYLTTYYCDFNRPVFDPACDYILWKATGKSLNWPELGREGNWLLDEAGRGAAGQAVRGYAARTQLSGQEKDELLATLAGRLGVDYAAILSQRLFHIMTREEAAELAGKGLVDLQLHTHRHRVSKDRAKFAREIDDNRERLTRLAPGPFTHFCYPGGFHLPEFEQWLPEFGVRSATTCEVSLATQTSHPMLLPRLVDHNHLSDGEFLGWLSGVAQFFPQRQFQPAPGQLMEDQPG